MDSQLLRYPSTKKLLQKSFWSRDNGRLEIFSTDLEEVKKNENNSLKLIYLRPKINDIRRINKHFIQINKKLKCHGLLVCNCETIEQRYKRIHQKYGKATILFLPIDFLYKRVFPKLAGIKRIYFALSHGRNRVLSKAEVLGRLHYCGFHLVKIEEVDNRLHLIMKKVNDPCYDPEPSYGPIYKKKSIGKDGRLLNIYKFRTMHPYAEYLQDFMVKKNGYAKSGDGIGKIDSDFRVTSWGRFLRKYWLDELPQIINLIKGDLKLVGIRPLSESFIAEYPDDFLKERMKHKAGLLPPYAAHIHKSITEYIESEKKYLAAYKKYPILTDFRYFFWISFNILTNKIRSQ